MKDSFGREINYLRISVTQGCDLRCLYCGCSKPDENELTAGEIEKIVTCFALCGITKVRLTGGEPLIREDIAEIARRIKAIPSIEKLAVTTNGVLLSEKAKELKNAGVDAVNISLDALSPAVFQRMSGRDRLSDVLDGIEKALELGFSEVKINSVLIRGMNDGEAPALMALARDRKLDVRFIELMPFSGMGTDKTRIVTSSELLQNAPFLHPVETEEDPAAPAKYYSADGYRGRIGFISPVSRKFCESCNRIRLLSDGRVRPCLGYERSVELRDCLDDSEMLTERIRQAILSKPAGHDFEHITKKINAMNKIGG